MCSFFCENLCSKSFPYCDRKFIKRRDSGNKSNTGWLGDSEIKLFSDPVIRNISRPIGKAGRAFQAWFCFCSARAPESFRPRLGDERARSDSRLKIPFRMKPCESEVYSEPRYSQVAR